MISLREGLLVGFASEREFADDRAALLDDFAGKFPVLLRVEPVERRAQNPDGDTACGESAFMGLGVDSKGKTGHYAPSSLREVVSESVGLVKSVSGRTARADYSNRRHRESFDVALYVKG